MEITNPRLRFITCCLIIFTSAGAGLAQVAPRGAQSGPAASVSFDAASQTYVFQASGDKVVVYRIDISQPDLQRGLLRVSAAVDRGPFHLVLAGAGTRWRDTQGGVHEPGEYSGSASLVEHTLDGEVLLLRWQEQPGSHQLEKSVRIFLQGYSLVLHLQSASTWGYDGWAGVSLGHAEPQQGGARVLEIPYLPVPLGIFGDGAVMSAFVDPFRSSSVRVYSSLGQDDAGRLFVHSRTLSLPDTGGVAAPLDETAYLTVSNDLADVYPVSQAAASPYRQDLADRLVLDVWSLHRNFGVPEGVELAWRAAADLSAQFSVSYADGDGACGDGVVITVYRDRDPVVRLPVANGQSELQTWQGQGDLSAGQELRIRVDRAGNNSCDGTLLRVNIAAGGEVYDSVDDFSGSQGGRGFYYREFTGDRVTPMTFDAADNRWEGQAPYSILAAGFAHPGMGATAFLDARRMVRRYLEYGLERLAIIFHVWQHWGYDQGLPDHHPANPALGSGQELADFIATARQAGMLVALHENYTDMYPNNPPDFPSPLFDDSAVARDFQGNRKLGWLHPATHQQAFVIAAPRMIDFSRLESPSIRDDYAPNAAYLDVSTGWSPGRAIDHDAGHGYPPTLAFAFQAHRDLFTYLRSLYGGPLFGEGGEGAGRYDSFYAGWVDAVERQTEHRRWGRLVPDYELLCVRPLMLNHGQGYYSRYFTPYGQSQPTPEAVDLDQYRSSELVFGHAGFLGEGLPAVSDWLGVHAPEYWLLQALQTFYAGADYLGTRYFTGSNFVDLTTAITTGLDLVRARLAIDYRGLSIYINRDSPQYSANSMADFSYRQGEGGWGYYEDLGSGLQVLRWDPEAARWQGSRHYSFMTSSGAHPDGGAIIRTFTMPVAATVQVAVDAKDTDLNCGDGVLARLLQGSSELWRCDFPGDVASACPPAQLTVAAAAGEVFSLRIEQKGDNYCDSTAYELDLSWQDGREHDWTVESGGRQLVLPPSGFYARSDDGSLEAGSVRLEGGQTADFVFSAGYDYVRSRSGEFSDIGDYGSDGALARVFTGRGNELHGQSLTRVSYGAETLLQLSARADFNLRLVGPRRAVVSTRNGGQASAVDVRWRDLPPAWHESLAAGSGHVELSTCDWQGNPQGAARAVGDDGQGGLLLDGLVEGQYYLLELRDDCGDGTCQAGQGENCGNCPQDCTPQSGQVCCGGEIVDGECCTDADCEQGRQCQGHYCVSSTDGGDGGTADGGYEDGDPGADISGDSGADAGPDGGQAGDPGGVGEVGCGCAGGRTGNRPLVILLLGLLAWRAVARRRG